MKILVCIKHVPDLEAMTATDSLGGLLEDGARDAAAGRTNRYDEYAVEAALLMRETYPVSGIDAVTVGARQAEAVLRRALGMGVDHGVHIHQPHQAFPSPFAIGAMIAAYARGNAYDLILCGAMSEDLMQGLVGPVIAGFLNRPCLTSVHSLEYTARTKTLQCEREVEGGRYEVQALGLPALVSIQSGIHPPRYPALSKLLRANKYPLETIEAKLQGAVVDRQHVAGTRKPGKKRAVQFLNGSGEEKAQALISLLRNRGRL